MNLRLYLVVVLSLHFFCLGEARAQRRPRPPSRGASQRINRPVEGRVNRAWERRADRNRDGEIDRKEARKATAERAEVDTRWEARADKDNDGTVSAAEARRHRLNVMDTNNDGKVSAAEKRAFWGAKRYAVVAVYTDYDSDGDGYLTGDEAQDALCDRVEQVSAANRIEVVSDLESQFDTNGDGFIDLPEARQIEMTVCE